jgi:hypothetical protein
MNLLLKLAMTRVHIINNDHFDLPTEAEKMLAEPL